MKVLITGGAGYLGTELSYLLAPQVGIEKIVIYDNLSRNNYNAFIGISKFFPNKIQFIEGDILDTRKLKKVIAEVDAVIHLAAKVSTPFSDENPHMFEQVNHWGTAELTYAIEAADHIQKFIYASSVSVYGFSANPFTIDSPLNPRTFYGISKMRGEEHVARISDKTKTFILRLGNIYGYSKSMRFDAVINKFMFDANFKNKITIHGDGNQNRAFIHINSASHYFAKVLLGNELEPGNYNVTEENFAVNDVVDSLKELYPSLEMIFVSQHMKLRELMIEPDKRVEKLNVNKIVLKDALSEFKKEFTI